MKAGRRGSLFAALGTSALLIWAVCSLTACGAQFELSCGKDSSAKDHYQTYSDPTWGYTLDYPADWELKDLGPTDMAAGSAAAGGITIYDPEGEAVDGYSIDLVQVAVYRLTTPVDKSNMEDVRSQLQNLLGELETQDPSWKQTEPLSAFQAGGLDGYSVSYDFLMNETPAHTTLCFLFTGDTEYQILLQAAKKSWQDNQAAFDLVLSSFKTAPR